MLQSGETFAEIGSHKGLYPFKEGGEGAWGRKGRTSCKRRVVRRIGNKCTTKNGGGLGVARGEPVAKRSHGKQDR